MKIAYLLGSLDRGGAEILMLDVFRKAKDVGLEIIGVYRKRGQLLNDFLATGVLMFQLRPRNIFDVAYLFRLRKILKENKIQIVHVHQPIDAVLAWIVCLGAQVKIILSIHGYDYSVDRIADYALGFAIKKTDLNIFVSNTQKKYNLSKYSLLNSDKQITIHNGISFEKFENVKYSSLREELNISNNGLLLASVGSFSSGRDQMTICKFLNLLKDKGVDFKFVFAGAKSKKEAFLYDRCLNYCKENNLQEHVFFLGPRGDVPNILRQLDAFIYSSNHDTFGIAVIEAMAVGIPVFVNDWPVMAEITGNGRYANLYATKHEEDLFARFMDFVENVDLHKKKAKEAAAWVKKKYGIMNHLRDLHSAYKSVLNH